MSDQSFFVCLKKEKSIVHSKFQTFFIPFWTHGDESVSCKIGQSFFVANENFFRDYVLLRTVGRRSGIRIDRYARLRQMCLPEYLFFRRFYVTGNGATSLQSVYLSATDCCDVCSFDCQRRAQKHRERQVAKIYFSFMQAGHMRFAQKKRRSCFLHMTDNYFCYFFHCKQYTIYTVCDTIYLIMHVRANVSCNERR